jgi:hypothetical protein
MNMSAMHNCTIDIPFGLCILFRALDVRFFDIRMQLTSARAGMHVHCCPCIVVLPALLAAATVLATQQAPRIIRRSARAVAVNACVKKDA